MFLSDIANFTLNKKQLFAVTRIMDKKASVKIARKKTPFKRMLRPNVDDFITSSDIKLTPTEQFAIKYYAGSGHRFMNGGDDYKARYFKSKVDSGLRKLPKPTTQDKPLLRKMVISEDQLPNFLSNYKSGKRVTSKSLTSTSQQTPGVKTGAFGNVARPDQKKVTLNITPRKNTRSRYIESISGRKWDNEGENLFPTRTGFKTRNVRLTDDGYVLDVDEV